MKKKVVLFVIGLVLAVILLAGNIKFGSYDGLNKGYVMDLYGHTIGYETIGQPGFFFGNY
jgi:hypothetical protein